MAAARYLHTATLLNNGRILITGGGSSVGLLASAEVYDPVTGAFNVAGDMAIPRRSHTATLLSNGKVLIAGGSGGTNRAAGECGALPTGHADSRRACLDLFDASESVDFHVASPTVHRHWRVQRQHYPNFVVSDMELFEYHCSRDH